MNPISGVQRHQAGNIWVRLARRFSAWIIAGPEPQSNDIQQKLLHNSMRKKNTLIVVHLSIAVMASIAIVITEQTWAYVWLLAEVVLGGVRLAMHFAFEKAEADGRDGNAIARSLLA